MQLVIDILVCTCLILVGATSAPPYRYVVLALAIIALLLAVLGGLTLFAHR